MSNLAWFIVLLFFGGSNVYSALGGSLLAMTAVTLNFFVSGAYLAKHFLEDV